MFSTQLQLYLDRANVFVHGFPASTVFYGEHGCRGDGANMAGRVAYARNLDDSQARPFLDAPYIDGHEWLKPFGDLFIAPVATP